MASKNTVRREQRERQWKWIGEISDGKDVGNTFYGLVLASVDSREAIEVYLCNGESSMTGSIPNVTNPHESLALISENARFTAIRRAFSHNPPLARMENNELRISVPWGIEYGADINLDIESVLLKHMPGSSLFLDLLFSQIEQGREELTCLKEKVQHLQKERRNLQRAKKNLDKYSDSRAERLRVAAQVLNEFKKTCRLAKGVKHGPEENIGEN